MSMSMYIWNKKTLCHLMLNMWPRGKTKKKNKKTNTQKNFGDRSPMNRFGWIEFHSWIFFCCVDLFLLFSFSFLHSDFDDSITLQALLRKMLMSNMTQNNYGLMLFFLLYWEFVAVESEISGILSQMEVNLPMQE